MLKLFLFLLVAISTLASFPSQAAGGKGEDCDPKKVDKAHNECRCDPEKNDWVRDECLPKCPAGTERVGKICTYACEKGYVHVEGKCVLDEDCDVVRAKMGKDWPCPPPDPVCRHDEELISGKCYKICGNRSERVGTECVEKCGNHKERVGTECKDFCGNHRDRVGHDCRDKCREGYKRSDSGECIPCEFDNRDKNNKQAKH